MSLGLSIDEKGLLAAIRGKPDDDMPRLVYADWLDEQGRNDQAAFIRVDCDLAQYPVRMWRNLALKAHRDVLEEKLRCFRDNAYTDGASYVDYCRGMMHATVKPRNLQMFVAKHPEVMDIDLWFEPNSQREDCSNIDQADLSQIWNLRIVGILDQQVWDQAIMNLANNSSLNAIKSLSISHCYIGQGRGTSDLVESDIWNRLRWFHVDNCDNGVEFANEIVSKVNLRGLELFGMITTYALPVATPFLQMLMRQPLSSELQICTTGFKGTLGSLREQLNSPNRYSGR